MSDLGSIDEPDLIPKSVQPSGLRYLFYTWSGRLLALNTLVFIYICIRTGNIVSPDVSSLLALGAKDPVRIAQGEFWRFLTPIFVHVGIFHFAFNSYFLYVVGYQLEQLLGAPWFLATYILSGVAGNVASSVFSVNLSAGASSSLFGLLGAGFLLERAISKRVRQLTGRNPQNRAYAMTVIVNIGLGILVPFIDNSAHIGGLLAGLLMTYALVNLRPNNLQPRRPVNGVAALLLFAGLLCVGIYTSMSPKIVVTRLSLAGDKAEDVAERIFHYSQALVLSPTDSNLRIKRARAYLDEGAINYAFADLRTVLAEGGHESELRQFANEMDQKGQQIAALELRQMIASKGLNP